MTEQADASLNAGPPKRVTLFGIPFSRTSQKGIVDDVERLVASREPAWIVTANIQQVGIASRDASYRETIASADLVTADGMPICWVARWLGKPLGERVTGADLIEPVAQRAAQLGWRVFLLGGAPGVADRAAEHLSERFPELNVVGTHTPPLLSAEELADSDAIREAVKLVRDAHPHLLLVALGSPKQEIFIATHLKSLAVPVSIGIGGSLDFLVGLQPRAPRWMRRVGLEWLHRALSSPRRLVPRYLREGFTFARLALRERFQHPS